MDRVNELFNNLMNLCATTDESKFFFKDFTTRAGNTARIFSYNYASYTDWCLPDALECRGIMFLMRGEKPVRIMARPMEKFFNLGETPFTMNLDLTEVQYLMTKADGSLVSSYIDEGYLYMKSKGSINSEQSQMAMGVLNDIDHEALRDEIATITGEGFTCNFEYVSPCNRIVLPYEKKGLILLNVRDIETGEYIPHETLFKNPVLRPYLTETFEVDQSADWVQQIRDTQNIEGYVAVMTNGLRFKLKTDWYCALHHTKDSITSNERLFGSVVAGASDDLRGMFDGDTMAINKIDEFETVHLNYLQTGLLTLSTLHEQLKGKDRKDYALGAQSALRAIDKEMFFSVFMQQYNGFDPQKVLEGLNKVFLKNYMQFVPTQYVK